MKKSIKILALVLSLALICGAIVIGVVAKTADSYKGTTGVYVITGADLQGATVGKTVKADDGTSNATTGLCGSKSKGNYLEINLINRSYGTATIVQSPYDSNKYVYFTATPDGPTNNAGYFSTGYKAHDDEKTNNNSDTYTYQVFDTDVCFPDGKSIYYQHTVQLRGYDSAGAKLTPGIVLWRVKSENQETDNVTLYDTNSNAIANLVPSVWTRITSVVEVIKTEGADTVINLYTFINEQLVSKVAWSSTDGAKLRLSTSQWWFSEYRGIFIENHSSSTYLQYASIAVDNVSWFAINPTTYDATKLAQLKGVLATGVGASLSDWDDSLYDENDVKFGVPVATIGEGESIQYFDSIEKAVAAANAGDTINLVDNSVEPSIVNKTVTIMKNGFTANIVNDDVKYSETDDAYVFDAPSAILTVRVQPCSCGKNCFGAKTIKVYDGENIWDKIVQAYGKEISCSYEDGDAIYNFDGFLVTDSAAELFEGGKLDKSTVVTEDFAGKVAVISVAYSVNTPYAKVFEADGTTLVKKFYSESSFQDALSSVDGKNGRKLVFYADYSTENGLKFHKYMSHSFTLDLNGYTFKHLTEIDADTKTNSSISSIYLNSNTNAATITSSVVGGKIFSAACYKKHAGAGAPFIASNAHDAIVNVIGKNESGETTLSFYGATFIQGYAWRIKVNVDGGFYSKNRGDNFALFDLRVLNDCNFKNATFDASNGPTFAFCARTASMGDVTPTVNIDNCISLNGTFIDYISDIVTVNITNTVIGGNLKLRNESTAAAPSGDEVIIGKGCKLKKGITIENQGVIYDGDIISISETHSYSVQKNSWTVGSDNFTVAPTTFSVTLDKMVMGENPEFIYVTGGKTFITYGDVSFFDVVNQADKDSTVKLMKDVTCVTTTDCGTNSDVAIFRRSMTLDLNGKTFTLLGDLAEGINTQPAMSIYSNVGLTVKGGTLVSGYRSGIDANGNERKSAAYSMFTFSGNSSSITLDNCKFYGSSIVYSYGGLWCTVNVKNCEINKIFSTAGATGNGFISSRALITVKASNSKFDLGSYSLLSVAGQKKGETQTEAVATFTNCDIVTNNTNKVIDISMELQKIIFNNCSIYGKLDAPSVSSMASFGAGQGTITLGEGTVVKSYNEDTTFATEGYVIYTEESQKEISFCKSSGNHYDKNFAISSEPTANTYVFVYKVVSEAYAEPYVVSWYDHNGTLITTTEVRKNTTATPPEVAPVVAAGQDGWWRQMYDLWSTTAGGEATDDFLITENCAFYRTKGEVKPYLTAARFNLSLMGHAALNLYIPTALPDGITMDGSTASEYISGLQSTTTGVILDGVSYTCYTVAFIGAVDFAVDKNVTVKFVANVDGNDVHFVQNIKLSPLRYAQAVLKDYENGTGLYDSLAYKVVANMLRYSKTVSEYHGKTVDSTIASLVNKYESALCDPIDPSVSTDFPESDMVLLGDAAPYVESISFEISTYQPRYAFKFKYGSNVIGFKLEAVGFTKAKNGTEECEINWGYQSYAYNQNWGVLYYDDLGQLISPRNGGFVCNASGTAISGKTPGDWSAKHIAYIYSENIPIYNIDEDMTIILTLDNGTQVKGEYNIDTYYNNLKNSGNYSAATLTKVRTFFKVMRDYAEAVARYRFPLGKYPYVDFDKINSGDTPTVSVTQFGAKPNDGEDDYAYIKLAFGYANKMGYDVTFPDGTYTIGTNTNGYISVKTNVDFGNAKFDIRDSEYTSTANKSYDYDLFRAESDYDVINVTPSSSSQSFPTSIAEGASNIGYAPGYPALVTIYNENVKNYIRHGANNSSVDSQTSMYEIVLVDAEGNVDPSTPVFFTYTEVTKLVVRRADDKAITIRGGEFITDVNNMPSKYTYVARGLKIMRSNVTVDGVTHKIINEENRTNGAPYNGFYRVENCNNVVIQNCITQAPKYYVLEGTGDGTGVAANNMGTYGLSAGLATNLTFKNVVQSNFWYDESKGIVNNSSTGGVWGIGGTNDCKNMWYDGCTLTRYDAHRGVVNGGIINSTISGVSLLGGGTFEFRNNNVYSNDADNIITLRTDYGASWKGTMNFENINWHCTKSAGTWERSIDLYLISATKTEEHYFGYTCYAPHTVNISGTIALTLTGKMYNGNINSTVNLGKFYVGRLTSTGTYSGCHGCDGTYGTGTAYVTGTTVNSSAALTANGSSKSINTSCTAS